MKIKEINARLKDNGINLPAHFLRRRIDVYIDNPNRDHKNNRRDLTNEEFEVILIALAIESKGLAIKEVKRFLAGYEDKNRLIGMIIDSNKVDRVIQRWVEGG